jgi:hypothetical protein
LFRLIVNCIIVATSHNIFMNSTQKTAEDPAYKPKQYRLREMPKDIYDIIMDVQTEQRKRCQCQFSKEQTIYKIIRKAAKQETNEQS